MILAVLLMPVNWLLEVFKWHALIRNYETITFGRAVESVLLGFPYALLGLGDRGMVWADKLLAG